MQDAIMGYHVRLPQDITCVLEPSQDGATPVATVLAATIGPACSSVATLVEMLQAGMRIARFDLTYGDLATHVEAWHNLRKAVKQANKLCAVMVNPPGPDVRVRNRSNNPIKLTAGQVIHLSNDATVQASSTCLPVTWPDSVESSGIVPGTDLFVGEYLCTDTTSAHLTVESVDPQQMICTVHNTCTLEGLQLTVKVTASDGQHHSPCLGETDALVLSQWVAATSVDSSEGVRASADFICLPRTRSAEDVVAGRALLASVGLGHCKVVAKLEEMEGMIAHKEILEVADVIIFSRGTLGVCMESEKVFVAQKMLLAAANLAGKPVFVTRVVDSMADAPRPTRAEATDIANLVLDGADGVLLGSETFRGQHPVGTLQTVSSICRAAEEVFDNHAHYRALMDVLENPFSRAQQMLDAEALAASAVRVAHKMDAKLIVCFTVSGRTARLLAKYKPSQPILTVVCIDPTSAKFSVAKDRSSLAIGVAPVISEVKPLHVAQLSTWSHISQAKAALVYRGTIPVMVDAPPGANSAQVLEAVLEYAKTIGLASAGDRVVVSQCPRNLPDNMPMNERGVISLVTVDEVLA